MLTVSPGRCNARLHACRDADLPTGAGLRIVVDRNHRSLSMGLARNPEPQDEVVVTSDGAHIFLSQSAARRAGATNPQG